MKLRNKEEKKKRKRKEQKKQRKKKKCCREAQTSSRWPLLTSQGVVECEVPQACWPTELDPLSANKILNTDGEMQKKKGKGV